MHYTDSLRYTGRVSHQDIARLLQAVQSRCIEISDDNLPWTLFLLTGEDSVVSSWEDLDPDDLRATFNSEVEGAIEDCEVDDLEWRLELFVDDELEQTWNQLSAPQIVG